MTDDLPFLPGDPDPSRFERPARRCYRHDWAEHHGHPLTDDAGQELAPAPVLYVMCRRCGKARDEAVVTRNRRNAKRGKAIQRKRIEGLGGQNLAGNNENLDGIGLRFAFESKSGSGAFSERYWRWLTGIPLMPDRTPVLIVTDAPGSGHRARSYVVVRYEDWRDLHGE